MNVFINQVAVATPGLHNWEVAKNVFNSNTPFEPAPLEKYKPQLLPPNERRRATSLVRLAFQVCEAIADHTDNNLGQTQTVFASSGGDYQIIDQICRALCKPERMVSPTQFHNSVHNSAAGYWGIATHSPAPSTSISSHDFSFAAGLLEAAAITCSENSDTLLVVYDTQPPEPIIFKRPITLPFATALLFSPTQCDNTIAKVELSLSPEKNDPTPCKHPEVELLRSQNPAARSLPLLESLATLQQGSHQIIKLAMMGEQTLALHCEKL
ncbi:beta-ketoacyl synthase chain length factor [Marinibactrum halimedae]|uniref:Beta-ketoacyl synthase-like N-terminal domain-containing protein n=1 Tax=Marinibactrum halimedae TaxID=1444977 RepID=A0AA37T861_9GAMM|nr:beta-ketoacyl synthase chain length factor [Marinibactrum halimedae]MCD9460425.1 beta-ketoacyl synthase chain length factor [Marinibactrum halimedae]GLS27444.1 hypothetical protein GCM10007877_31630 [Marinibactrum halimedae]